MFTSFLIGSTDFGVATENKPNSKGTNIDGFQ